MTEAMERTMRLEWKKAGKPQEDLDLQLQKASHYDVLVLDDGQNAKVQSEHKIWRVRRGSQDAPKSVEDHPCRKHNPKSTNPGNLQ